MACHRFSPESGTENRENPAAEKRALSATVLDEKDQFSRITEDRNNRSGDPSIDRPTDRMSHRPTERNSPQDHHFFPHRSFWNLSKWISERSLLGVSSTSRPIIALRLFLCILIVEWQRGWPKWGSRKVAAVLHGVRWGFFCACYLMYLSIICWSYWGLRSLWKSRLIAGFRIRDYLPKYTTSTNIRHMDTFRNVHTDPSKSSEREHTSERLALTNNMGSAVT